MPFSGLRWCLLILVLGGVMACVLALMGPRKPAPFMLLRPPLRLPVPLRDRLTGWIPRTPAWAWAWRLEGIMLGQRKPLMLDAEVVSWADSSRPSASGLSLGPPSFSATNGLEVWLLDKEQVKGLRERLQREPGTFVLARPRVSTADGIEAALFQGQSVPLNGSTEQVGLTMGCFARVRSDSADLRTWFTVSEAVTNRAAASAGSLPLTSNSIQTNLDVALRLQVPAGSGFFLLDGRSLDSRRQRIGVLVDPPQPKRLGKR